MVKSLHSLPVHHIDTSIILEPQRTEDGRWCKKYLQRVGNKYLGIVSLPVLSELELAVFGVESYEERHELLDLIYQLIRERKIGFYSPKDIGKLDVLIREKESRIDPVDRLIVASAIEHEADFLVSIDRKLVDNRTIKEEFELKIVHPKSLI